MQTALRSPLFTAVIFIATVIPVCSDPVIALAAGAGQWTHPLPPLLVILIAAAACFTQAVAVTRLAVRAVPGVLLATGAYLAVAVLLGVPSWATPMQLVIAVAMFTLGSSRSVPTSVGWALGSVAASLAALTLYAQAAGAPPAAALSFVLTEGTALASVAFAGLVLGMLWAANVRRTQAARARALKIEQLKEQEVEESRAAERGRIAQELHDVAGQHLAGLVSLCDASMDLAPAHPEQALELIEEVRAEGRYAAASLYGALGDLRAVNTVSHKPTPDLRALPELLDFWRERGMLLHETVQGDVGSLPSVVSTTAYRGIKEALSNAAKHAAGSDVSVVVTVTQAQLDVVVRNGLARHARTKEAELGLGWGLESLRDRLALVHGMLHTSADDADAWRLKMTIPLTPDGSPGAGA